MRFFQHGGHETKSFFNQIGKTATHISPFTTWFCLRLLIVPSDSYHYLGSGDDGFFRCLESKSKTKIFVPTFFSIVLPTCCFCNIWEIPSFPRPLMDKKSSGWKIYLFFIRQNHCVLMFNHFFTNGSSLFPTILLCGPLDQHLFPLFMGFLHHQDRSAKPSSRIPNCGRGPVPLGETRTVGRLEDVWMEQLVVPSLENPGTKTMAFMWYDWNIARFVWLKTHMFALKKPWVFWSETHRTQVTSRWMACWPWWIRCISCNNCNGTGVVALDVFRDPTGLKMYSYEKSMKMISPFHLDSRMFMALNVN